MNQERNIWVSFQGCFVAMSHYVISVLIGIATWHFIKSLAFPEFVVWTLALIMGMLTFQLIYIFKSKIGDKHG